MDSTRSAAYGTALKSLRDLQASKFTDEQMDLFTETLDVLLFADSSEAISAAMQLYTRTVETLDMLSGRGGDVGLSDTLAERLKGEIRAVGAAPVAA